MNRRAIIIAAGIVAVAVCWLYRNWWFSQNPYSNDGLQMEWSFGASTTVPSLEMWADYRGQKIQCPVFFGQMENPALEFRDYDGDGRRDIVLENHRYKQVVSFVPAQGDIPPQFKVIRNDIAWP